MGLMSDLHFWPETMKTDNHTTSFKNFNWSYNGRYRGGEVLIDFTVEYFSIEEYLLKSWQDTPELSQPQKPLTTPEVFKIL